MNLKFYRCNVCGQMVEVINNTNLDIRCCARDMEELVPNTEEGAGEKHIPVVTIDGDEVHVTVGEIEHPMSAAHYIRQIILQTTHGCQRVDLIPGCEPKACFKLMKGEEAEAVYEYCNIHGLWKKDLRV